MLDKGKPEAGKEYSLTGGPGTPSIASGNTWAESEVKNYNANVLDIKFYLYDEDGNQVLNKDGTTKQFRIKDGIRFKPLEYLCEDFDTDILEEVA